LRVWSRGVLSGNNRLIDALEKNKWLSDIKEPELWEIL
jgi:hypothetical protein